MKRHIYPALVVWWSLGVNRGTYRPLWWYVSQSDSLTVESVVPRPLSLVARSHPLTQPVQSLYPLCIYIGKRHIWKRVLSFGLMPHGIQTNSPKRWASFALFATNEATHISRFGGMSANRIHSPSNPSCLAPCLWSPGLAHSLYPYSLSVHYACT